MDRGGRVEIWKSESGLPGYEILYFNKDWEIVETHCVNLAYPDEYICLSYINTRASKENKGIRVETGYLCELEGPKNAMDLAYIHAERESKK
jgi:hypothetical protein